MDRQGSDGGCPVCGREIRPGAKFCGRCGTVLPERAAACPVCGRPPKPADRFCRGCGAALLSSAVATSRIELVSGARPAAAAAPSAARIPARVPAQLHPRRRGRLLMAAAAGVVLVAVVVGVTVPLTRDGRGSGTESAATGQMGTGNGASGVARIEAGPAEEVAHATLGAEGGSVVVDRPGSSINGLKLEVPAGSYTAPVDLRITESPITDLRLEAEVTGATPLIEISGADRYADGLMTLRIPVTIEDDEVAMAFLYDADRGALEAVPAVELTSSSLTVATRHFSKYVVLKGKKVYLDHLSLPKKGSAAYMPGQDTWSIPNTGSYIAPGGFCRGMALSSVWYFTEQKYSKGDGLWRSEYENGLDSSKSTVGFWQDDVWAIQLCSLAQHVWKTQSGVDIGAEYRRMLKQAGFPIDTFYQVALALAANHGQPVLLALHDGSPAAGAGAPAAPAASSGHSVVCYGIEGHTLKVADPNLPEETDLTIEYRDGALQGFTTFNNYEDLLLGRSRTYSYAEFDGLTSFYDLGVLRSLWTAYEAGSIEDYRLALPGPEASPLEFPDYFIEISEYDDQGMDLGTRVLDLDQGTQVRGSTITLELRPQGFDGRVTVFRFSDLKNPVFNDRIRLQPGENLFGLYVEAQDAQGWWWAGFHWVTITATTQTSAQTDLPPLDYNTCTLIWELETALFETWSHGKPAGTNEFGVWGTRWRWEDLKGSFYGNTFTATWTKSYKQVEGWTDEPAAPGECVRRGELKVTFDPVTHEVVRYVFENTNTDASGWATVFRLEGGGLPNWTQDSEKWSGRWRVFDGGPLPRLTQDVLEGAGEQVALAERLLEYEWRSVGLYLFNTP